MRGKWLANTSILVLLMWQCAAEAELLMPGEYVCTGRVVKRGSGEFAVFWGYGRYRFPAKVQGLLEPHIGRFVKVKYLREASDQHPTGSVISGIKEITVLAEDPNHLPVIIKVSLTKREFGFEEPIQLSVALTNRSKNPSRLHLYIAKTALCQDYQGITSLEPHQHYYHEHPYGVAELQRAHILQPAQKITFRITSQTMMQPGKYQLVYSVPLDNGLRIQSELQEVTVLAPGDKGELIKALKFWLRRAAYGQRVEIAKRLLAEGDSSGIREVLRLLKAGEYSKEHFIFDDAFRFAWRYGGEDGEALMLNLIHKERKQDYAGRMIAYVHLSKNRVELLEELLGDRNHTSRGIDGWYEKPRICDIAAAWLTGYTNGKMRFPRDGTEAERDQAVRRVLKQLKKNPGYFSILSTTEKHSKKSAEVKSSSNGSP